MDTALEMEAYLPISYRSPSEQDYVRFLWDAFQSNYTSEKFEFSSLAFHLLYMSFVSFSIWQIKLAKASDFRKALIGWQVDDESKLLNADTPFKFYEKLKESQIFRFLKLIGCSNAHVGEFAKFVKRRNKIAHPTGTVFFNDQPSIDAEIESMMREVVNIQRHMRPIVLKIYKSFLKSSGDPETREYALPGEEIQANLIHRSYCSQKDIEICLSFDIAEFAGSPNEIAIAELHRTLAETYPEAAGVRGG